MTHPSWVALHGMAHSFIELHKPLLPDKAVNCERDPCSKILFDPPHRVMVIKTKFKKWDLTKLKRSQGKGNWAGFRSRRIKR